jgi:hypothetical protein
MKINTKLTKISRNIKKQKGFINPGIYKGSTMILILLKITLTI